jgi:signal transduction histidine kinase
MVIDPLGLNVIHVLLVDDDEDAFVLTRDLLAEVHEPRYTLDWAASYEAGLESMSRNDHQVYLIDYQMGSRNGLELIQDARESGCTGAIVFLTGMESQYVDMMAMNHGASDFLVKGSLTPLVLDRSIRYARQHQEDLNSLRLSSQELKRLNKELHQSEHRLQELNASKDRFFSIIAHDLKSPFVSLLGYSELLSQEINAMSKEDIQTSAAMMHHAGTRLYKLLENLLTWSRLQTDRITFQPSHVDVSDVAEHTLSIYSDAARMKNVSLANRVPRGLHAVTDAQMLRTILENLVSNAIKFTGRDGSVEISAWLNGGKTHLEVRDTGVGIPHDILPELFRIDRHQTTPGTEQETGTGLGLILCKEFADRCGASLEVISKVGNGSAFKLVIPGLGETPSVAREDGAESHPSMHPSITPRVTPN